MQPAGPGLPTGSINSSGAISGVLERIGRGTFGDVHRAWDSRLDREVALKLLPATPLSEPHSSSSLIREGRLLAKVRHPNVVTIYGAEQIGDQIGLWMEFVRGQTLEQLLQEVRRFALMMRFASGSSSREPCPPYMPPASCIATSKRTT